MVIKIGALNHQTAHHLFPGICQFHYMALTPIVVRTCREFGVKYSTSPNFFTVLMVPCDVLM